MSFTHCHLPVALKTIQKPWFLLHQVFDGLWGRTHEKDGIKYIHSSFVAPVTNTEVHEIQCISLPGQGIREEEGHRTQGMCRKGRPPGPWLGRLVYFPSRRSGRLEGLPEIPSRRI